MNLLARIKRRIHLITDRRILSKKINRKGGCLDGHIKLFLSGVFEFGRNVTIHGDGIDNVSRSQIIVFPNAMLSIGDNTGMSQVSITCKKRISIGSNVKIGAGTMIFDTDFHNPNWKVRKNHDEDLATAPKADVTISDDVFIGVRCIIEKGVTIGARSIIAAGSVVIKDIPSDCIAGGNPCKVLKQLER